MLYPIPLEAKEKQTDLQIPLTDGEKAYQYEAKLKMPPFVLEAQQTAPSNIEKQPLSNKEEDTSSESMEEDTDALLKGIVELDFDHPRLQKKVNQRAFIIWSNAQPTKKRGTKRKRFEFLSLRPKREADKE